MFLPDKKFHFWYITQEFAKIEANYSICVTFTRLCFNLSANMITLILSYLFLFCKDQGAQIRHCLSVIIMLLLCYYYVISTCSSRVPTTILNHSDIFIKTFVLRKERSHKHVYNFLIRWRIIIL